MARGCGAETARAAADEGDFQGKNSLGAGAVDYGAREG